MAAPSLMMLPAELRIKIWRCTTPQKLDIRICPPDGPHGRPPHESPIYGTRRNPVLPLLLLNKTINAEVTTIVTEPELVVNFRDIFCLNYWLTDRRAWKYLSHFRSIKLVFPPYRIPEGMRSMDEATHRSELEKDAIETVQGEAPALVLKNAEWIKEAEPRSWTFELDFDMPRTTKNY